MSTNPHIGDPFDGFLIEEGIYDDVAEVAAKRVLIWQLEQAMHAQHLTKTELARRMHTSRAALDRLLDPKNESVTLGTLQRVARSVGKRLRIELV